MGVETDLTAKSVRHGRWQVITRMCNLLYELAASRSEHQYRTLLIEIDAEITHLWDLYEVEDG